MADLEEIIGYAIVFLVLFVIGGVIGSLSLPIFPGRFFISGLIIAAFATGAGSLVIKAVIQR